MTDREKILEWVTLGITLASPTAAREAFTKLAGLDKDAFTYGEPRNLFAALRAGDEMGWTWNQEKELKDWLGSWGIVVTGQDRAALLIIEWLAERGRRQRQRRLGAELRRVADLGQSEDFATALRACLDAVSVPAVEKPKLLVLPKEESA